METIEVYPVLADVGDADVVAEDDEDVGLIGCAGGPCQQHGYDCQRNSNAFHRYALLRLLSWVSPRRHEDHEVRGK
jgi:hypothetical protein